MTLLDTLAGRGAGLFLVLLPLALALRNHLVAGPSPALTARVLFRGLLQGFALAVLASGFLAVLRMAGADQLVLEMENQASGWGLASRLPGLLLAALVEEGARILILGRLGTAMPVSGNHGAGPEPPSIGVPPGGARESRPAMHIWNAQALVLAALVTGLVYGILEDFLLAGGVMPLFVLRSTAALAFHGAASLTAMGASMAGRKVSAFFFLSVLHLAFNWATMLDGPWCLASLAIPAFLILREGPFRKAGNLANPRHSREG